MMASTFQPNSSYTTVRKRLVCAAGLVGLELWLGIGVLSAVAAIMVVVKLSGLVFYRSPRRLGWQVVAIYAFVAVAITCWISFNWSLAQQHAKPVIVACEAYRVKNQHYSESLEAIVPEYLPVVPRAGLSRVSRSFVYSAQRTELYFAVMVHGVASYDFQKHAWTTND